jgi:GNAT superfamily N-acetyltransferase
VVGTAIAGYDGHRGWLYSVAVRKDYRRSGLGSSLVHHAERALAAAGCLKVNLQVLSSNVGISAQRDRPFRHRDRPFRSNVTAHFGASGLVVSAS